MKKISEVSRLTDNPHLNLYHLKGTNRVGKPLNYYIASRVKSLERLKLKTKRNDPDGIIVYSLYGEKRDRVVLVRQYRYSIDDYIYEFPAGLVEEGEDYREAGIRELKEETGLSLELIDADPMFEKPGFMSVGMTDESCATIYGYASGTPSKKGQEDSEEIEIVLADREEVKRILKEEHVAIMCAYMLMHFLQDKEPFDFLNL
ncbi:NUDIX hydrolase [Anaerostipes caccae]|uniref:NUDIX hydrolase n=1 Tax=Anaerostipes caccae TaxID=105841 RepID=UPI00101CB0C9|nr:NUDIX hydrolase [Anaerostipes caccae]